MIESSWVAEQWVADTTPVALESVGVDANGERSILLNSCGDLSLIRADLMPSSDESLLLRDSRLASAICCFVWVRRFALQTNATVNHVLECIGWKTALATAVVDGVAIHQLLLAEGQQLAGLYRAHALDVGHRGESPAGSTLSLILDCIDGAMVTPVVAGSNPAIRCSIVHDHISLIMS